MILSICNSHVLTFPSWFMRQKLRRIRELLNIDEVNIFCLDKMKYWVLKEEYLCEE